MDTSLEKLERQIEELVRAHLDCYRRAATVAVTRALTSAMNEPKPTVRGGRKARQKQNPKRSAEELGKLETRLLAAVCASPGETMLVLAAQLGVPSRQLAVPAKRLRHAGRIRSVGERNATRYFPMAEERAAKANLVSVAGQL